jgi:hypothetical protein
LPDEELPILVAVYHLPLSAEYSGVQHDNLTQNLFNAAGFTINEILKHDQW